MSSAVPVRRVTRATRATVVKDKENAVTRPIRATTRAKPTSTIPASQVDGKPTGLTRIAVSTAATRAKAIPTTKAALDPGAQGKRKREALGEVARPTINVVKDAPKDVDLKGKAKAKEAFEGVVLKKPTAPASTASRVPLAAVTRSSATTTTTAVTTTTTTSRRTRSATAQQQQVPPTKLKIVKEESVQETAPAPIDHATIIPVPAPRRLVAARTTVTLNTTRTQTQPRVFRAPKKEAERDEEDIRAFKKRRTSSDAPEAEEVEEAIQPEGHVQEADPNGDMWDDLDVEDADDPLMVSEYVVEIFEYLKGVEQTTMPNPNYMEMQKDLAWKMRGILTDWLIQVHSRFRLLPETLFLCVNIIDRFLSQRVVSLAKLQLVGITCMFISAKVEEIVAPSATNFLYCADSSYTEAEILQAERYVLKTLDWNMSYPNPIHFLRRVSKADEYNVQVRTIAKYLLEIQCLEWRLIAAPPSLMAAASIWLARLILGYEDWTPNLAHYSSYPESALIPTANLMLNYLLKPIRHQSFYRKYAGKKFLKSSVFVREWALSRWEEGTQVSLHDELPKIKILIQEAREREPLPPSDELEEA